jgi:preprotein translocase subunit SecB
MKKNKNIFLENSELIGVYKIKHDFDFKNRLELKKTDNNIRPLIYIKFDEKSHSINDKIIEIVVAYKLKSESPDENIIYFSLNVDFVLLFKCKKEYLDDFDNDELRSNLNNLKNTFKYLTLPYFRRIAQNDTLEANLPPLVLPLMRMKNGKISSKKSISQEKREQKEE